MPIKAQTIVKLSRRLLYVVVNKIVDCNVNIA